MCLFFILQYHFSLSLKACGTHPWFLNMPIRFLICVPAIAILLAACGGGSYDSYMASAKEALAKGDKAAAIIQLKNAVQQLPEAGEARLMLGQVFLDSGDTSSAAIEFRKAADLKYSPARVAPATARLLLEQRDYKKVVTQFAETTLADPLGQADLKTSLAAAYEALGDHPHADAALDEAQKAVPYFSPADILRIRINARAGRYAEALRLINETLERDTRLGEVWRLKGDVLLNSGGSASDAVSAYRQALSLRKVDLAAHAGLLDHLIAVGDMTAAAAQFENMKAALPGNPQTRYYEALLTYHRKDYVLAREQVQQLIKMAPEHLRTLQLAGAVEFELKSYSRAEEFLAKALLINPDLRTSRWMLAQTYLLTDQPAKAVAIVEYLLQKGSSDAQTLALAGEAYRRVGEQKKAQTYFAQAAKRNPADTRSRTLLVLDKLSNTESTANAKSDALIDELKAIAASDAGISTDVALVRTQLQHRNFEKALLAIDGLERKQPDKPFGANLRGMVELARNDVPTARKNFERAVALDKTYYPPVAMLATLDIAEKKPEQARKRFDDLLVANPKSVEALLGKADLLAQSGANKDDVTALIDSAVKLQPDASSARIALVEHQLRNNDTKAALQAARDGLAAMPHDPSMLNTMGVVLTRAGEYNQAIDTFNKLALAMPRSPTPYLRLAEVAVAQKDMASANDNLKRAIEIAPDMVAARSRLVEVQIASGDAAGALVSARVLQKKRPELALPDTLEGDVLVVQQSWPAAVVAYRRSFDKAQDSGVAIKLHAALNKTGASAEAEKLASRWLGNHPDDVNFLFHLAGSESLQGRFADAERHFQAVVKLSPDNAAAFNNLAWVTLKLGKPGATAYAEKANLLQPQQYAYMDTLAMALAADNKLTRAIEVQKAAVALQPSDHWMRLRLAKLYIKADDKAQGRVELERIAKIGRSFPGQTEVSELLKTM